MFAAAECHTHRQRLITTLHVENEVKTRQNRAVAFYFTV